MFDFGWDDVNENTTIDEILEINSPMPDSGFGWGDVKSDF